MNKIYFSFIIAVLFSFPILSQNNGQDIYNYKFDINLSDNTDTIFVVSTIDGVSKSKMLRLNLDPSMTINRIYSNNSDLTFSRNNDSVFISLPNNNFKIDISYFGKPKDGLIIGSNKFGDRTFFGDNWPNRAKNWLTVYDHPSDKAKVEFIVTAPNKYTVVSNGKLISKINKGSSSTFHYKTSYEIPTKVMVIGVAVFEKQTVQKSPFEITNFAYPQDKYITLTDYSLAPQVTTFFESLFGRYPFNKLYNVQSTTMYGGMENAGCIFYDENSVDGKNSNESLIAHEIAHQWFGNSVSEKDWNHLWLSEGFATYLENIYMQNKYGQEVFDSLMQVDKDRIIKFKKENPNKVLVPSTVDNPIAMLNAYSYQKGAWVLHMLRIEVGDEIFFKSLKQFYRKYKFSNADTNDFIKIIDGNYPGDLKKQFEPWLYSSTLPKYDIKWEFSNNKIQGRIIQLQEGNTFTNDVAIMIMYENIPVLKVIKVNSKNQNFEFDSSIPPLDIVIDPHNDILKEN